MRRHPQRPAMALEEAYAYHARLETEAEFKFMLLDAYIESLWKSGKKQKYMEVRNQKYSTVYWNILTRNPICPWRCTLDPPVPKSECPACQALEENNITWLNTTQSIHQYT